MQEFNRSVPEPTNSFRARFAGGYRLFSNSAITAGVSVAAGGGSWTAISDHHLKENFRTINTEELLQKVASHPITNWNYESQPASQRHIGPWRRTFMLRFISMAKVQIPPSTQWTLAG